MWLLQPVIGIYLSIKHHLFHLLLNRWMNENCACLCINNINNVSMWICGRVMWVMAMATFSNLWKVCGMSKEPLCWLLRIKEYYRIFSSCWSRSYGAWPACSCSCSCGRAWPRRCGSWPRPPPAAHPGTGPRPPHHWPGSQHQDRGSAWSHSACNMEVSVILQCNLQQLHNWPTCWMQTDPGISSCSEYSSWPPRKDSEHQNPSWKMSLSIGIPSWWPQFFLLLEWPSKVER